MRSIRASSLHHANRPRCDGVWQSLEAILEWSAFEEGGSHA